MGGLGGTSGNALDNQTAAPSLTFSFDKTVSISSLRMADAYQDGNSYSYVLTPSPNTGTVPTTVPTNGGVTVNLGSSFSNITSFTITPQSGGNAFFIVDNIVLQSILPVELKSFNASITANTVHLNWETATEVNNFGFEVERTQMDNKKWRKISFIQGHGNSNSPKFYSFTNNNVNSGDYLYRLKQVDIDGNFEYSPEIKVTIEALINFSIQQNFPNPFNPSTKINYSIPADGKVEIKVYDVLGKEIVTLVDENKKAGTYEVEFNAGNLTSGIYFYKIVSGDNLEIKKMILLK